ncbi:MAG: selenide, water dikinase SelD [Veillonella sp.]|uniref:selenide, water dikinase SelD n=1 Tax=Veillonella sp. TaxID=1926307 RepID=UPI0025E2DB0C|nr:selenide, water dikinase SelD [Veillonella sp.]MBS4913322.1 selenide, water dikinase SelD [Veillonella sp.]
MNHTNSQIKSQIKLTKYAAKGGCACKLGPHLLEEALRNVAFPTNENVLVDMSGADDAGVYRLNDTLSLVQTTDFFMPVVDDPFLFGKIAATNSLSDVYAMGGTPLTAMNLVAFPVPLVEQGVLADVMRGANEALRDAGVVTLGGHSIENEAPIFGLAVTGTVETDRIWRNKGVQPGDALILTKPLGTGVMTTALKGGLFEIGVQEAVQSMCTLNRQAAEVAKKFTVHSCTDVTGFSLMGHGREMAKGSEVSLVIETEKLPLFSDVMEAASMGLVPAATYGNRQAIEDIYFETTLGDVWQDICFDPQTSGGLLFAVPMEEREAFLEALIHAGVQTAAYIGYVKEKGENPIYVK